MKIRTDFVTNSSSSSYVIGKAADEHITLDSMYQLLRSMFKEYKQLQDRITEHYGRYTWCFASSDSSGKLRLEVENCSDNGEISRIVVEDDNETHHEDILMVRQQHWSEMFWYNVDWVDCETYEEYLKLPISADDRPFRILDLSVEDFDTVSDYFTHFSGGLPVREAFATLDTDCKDCDSCRYYEDECYGYPLETMRKCKKLIKENAVTREKAGLFFLGRVVVYTGEDEMPFVICNRLEEMSERFSYIRHYLPWY